MKKKYPAKSHNPSHEQLINRVNSRLRGSQLAPAPPPPGRHTTSAGRLLKGDISGTRGPIRERDFGPKARKAFQRGELSAPTVPIRRSPLPPPKDAGFPPGGVFRPRRPGRRVGRNRLARRTPGQIARPIVPSVRPKPGRRVGRNLSPRTPRRVGLVSSSFSRPRRGGILPTTTTDPKEIAKLLRKRRRVKRRLKRRKKR